MKKQMKKCTSILLLFALLTALVPAIPAGAAKEATDSDYTAVPLSDDDFEEIIVKKD